MKRRLVIVMLALVLAAIGTGGVFVYVNGADTRALAGMKAVSVLVARKSIPSGTSAATALHSGLLASEKLPAASVPPNAVRSVTPALSSLVMSAAIPSGQLLLRPMLVKVAQVTGGLAIPGGKIAVTVNFCLPEAVAGAVQAGSQVAVFDTVVIGGTGQVTAQPGCAGSHQQPTGSIVKTRLVLPRAQVVSVGVSAAGLASPAASSGSASSATSSGMLVTLAVSQADAERLIQLTVTGLPYLALLTTSSRTGADAGHLLRSQASATPTPKATHKPKAKAKPKATPTPTPKPTPKPKPTPTTCATRTPTPKPSHTPTPKPSHTPSPSPAPAPSPSPTPVPMPTPSRVPSRQK